MIIIAQQDRRASIWVKEYAHRARADQPATYLNMRVAKTGGVRTGIRGHGAATRGGVGRIGIVACSSRRRQMILAKRCKLFARQRYSKEKEGERERKSVSFGGKMVGPPFWQLMAVNQVVFLFLFFSF